MGYSQRQNPNAVSTDCSNSSIFELVYTSGDIQDYFQDETIIGANPGGKYFRPLNENQSVDNFTIKNLTINGGKAAIVLPSDVRTLEITNLELKNGATLVISSHYNGSNFGSIIITDIHIRDNSKAIMLLNDNSFGTLAEQILIKGSNLVEENSTWRLFSNKKTFLGAIGHSTSLDIGRKGIANIYDDSMVQFATDGSSEMAFSKVNTYSLARFRFTSRNYMSFIGATGRAQIPNTEALLNDPLYKHSYRWRAVALDELTLQTDNSSPIVIDVVEVNAGPVTVGGRFSFFSLKGNYLSVNDEQYYFTPWVCPYAKIDWDYDMYDYWEHIFEGDTDNQNQFMASNGNKKHLTISDDKIAQMKSEYLENLHQWNETLSPNPITSNFVIDLTIPNVELARMSVWDTNGKLVHTEFKSNLNEGKFAWKVENLDKLLAGTYYVRLLMDKEYLDPMKFVKL